MENAVATLTPTLAGIRVSDATGANARALAVIGIPEERPAIDFILHLARRIWRCARVGGAGAVGSTVRAVVLVVCFEDGEGLLC